MRYAGRSPAATIDNATGTGRPEIGFNYHGQIDKLFAGLTLLRPIDTLGVRPRRASIGKRRLQVVSRLQHDRLHVRISYHQGVDRQDTIQNLADGTVNARLEMTTPAPARCATGVHSVGHVDT